MTWIQPSGIAAIMSRNPAMRQDVLNAIRMRSFTTSGIGSKKTN